MSNLTIPNLGPCMECGAEIEDCVRKCDRTDRGCCRWCAHDDVEID